MRRADGFSMLEMLVATAITMAVTAAVFSVTNPVQGAFQTQPEVADMQQRLRVVHDTLYNDLVMAGAGTVAGALTGSLAPIVPYRRGSIVDTDPGAYRDDTLTLVYVPSGSEQIVPGQMVLVFDGTGSYDAFKLTAGSDWPPAATAVPVVSRTYYLNASARQLMSYDGSSNADVPVVDHVVGLTFEYYGDPQPPVLRKPLSDTAGPWTTYGPTPPNGVQQGTFPSGENCTFAIDRDANPPQVPRLAALDADPNTLVRLTEAQLTDGPWCPDASAPNRWDADLLRIRKVLVTVRVEAAVDGLRGPAGLLFTNGGTSKDGTKWVPDQEIRFEVSPRNLNLGR